MKNIFVVTSAIHSNIGIYSSTDRLNQTLQTIDSIYKFYKDPEIIVVEGGLYPPKRNDDLIGYLRSYRDNDKNFLDLRNEEQITHLHQFAFDPNYKHDMGGINGLAKTVAESYIMARALDFIKARGYNDIKRIFKISGRYVLSPLHVPDHHLDELNKYVFKKKEKTWMTTPGRSYLYSSRLWSMDYNLLDETISHFCKMRGELDRQSMHGGYIDMEHLLYETIPQNKIHEIKYTHCMGSIAPNGTLVYD